MSPLQWVVYTLCFAELKDLGKKLEKEMTLKRHVMQFFTLCTALEIPKISDWQEIDGLKMIRLYLGRYLGQSCRLPT